LGGNRNFQNASNLPFKIQVKEPSNNKSKIMKWIYGFLAVMCFARFQCHDDHQKMDCDKPCSHSATVKDLTGLDGCQFVLELADGSRLVPQKLTYIQAPDPEQDPGYYFNFIDGQKVSFDFRVEDGADACMAGQLVFLTCIKAEEIPEQN
jgi:hypothetical protein